MKLNIGCGRKRIDGYVGIDLSPDSLADIVAPAGNIPLADACADEVLAIHVLEHVYRWEVPMLLMEWARLLRRGGGLILEMPDIIKCARNLLVGSSEQLSMWGFYGDDRPCDPLMAHRWGWTFKTLEPVVAAAGFGKIRERITEYHGKGRMVRDFRLEAIRK